MKRQIRNGVFETNSSSTHAICVAKDRIDPDSLSENTVYFTHDDFGWEFDKYSDTYSKASYLYQAIWSTTIPDMKYDWKDKLKQAEYELKKKELIDKKCKELQEILSRHHIKCDFTEEHFDSSGWDIGYIDHGNELDEWVDKCFSDEIYLLTYLFGDSFVVTGNDNSDTFGEELYVGGDYWNGELKEKYRKYDIYEKGN